MLVDGPDHFQGEGGVDNSNNDSGDEHGNHGLSGEEASHHSTLRVSPQIHLGTIIYNLDISQTRLYLLAKENGRYRANCDEDGNTIPNDVKIDSFEAVCL